MSGRVTASPERVFVAPSQSSVTPIPEAKTLKEAQTRVQQSVALTKQSNELKASAAEHDRRALDAQKDKVACKERINQSSANVASLSDKQKKNEEAKQKIKEAQLRLLQRKNS